ncbi:MAG: Gfo/Idh/MocA family oxidoreductase, partial [Candidatus Aminicenantes bacterium]|nr:Gfo/Idh/MocA family oxidoreductase [Candidatus Aminicenantes bacterium]
MDESTKIPPTAEPSWSRRKFLGAASTAAAGLMVVPRHVVGQTPKKKAPSDTLNIACVGVGGMGYSDVRGCRTENVVALCDVDDEQMAKLLRSDELEPKEKAMYDKAAKYRDFRRMLEKEKGIDAVTVTVPDHNHAVIAMAAIKLGKHVYVQKPLTHTIKEARALAEAVKGTKLATQMGNQGHAGEGARLVCEWIWSGAIGNVTEVHCWTNRPIWPQGGID